MARVLLIEDDQLLSEMYQHALKAEGIECSVALDGVTGLKLAQELQPDLVLLDLMLPQMSGDEVLWHMRKSEECKDTKVVIMTNISESEAPEILNELAFEQYIVKANTTLFEVTKLVRSIVGSSKQPAEAA